MPVPTYDKFIEPLLRFLGTRADPVLARDAHDAVADALALTPVDREQTVPSGQHTYRNRCGWAHDRLKRAGYSISPRRGWWQLTATGRDFLAAHPLGADSDAFRNIAADFLEVRLRPRPDADAPPATELAPTELRHGPPSPDDQLATALAEIRASVTAELLELLGRVSPKFFEAIVLDVLHRMGYGATRADLQQVGGSGDGGIDGVISLDKLGLEKVYVQAKRWQGAVGRPEVQGFYGALAGQRANKGVFITTSTYTQQALTFAASVERIVLVDGVRLANFMIDHEVGVSSRPIRIPRIDSDYFDE